MVLGHETVTEWICCRLVLCRHLPPTSVSQLSISTNEVLKTAAPDDPDFHLRDLELLVHFLRFCCHTSHLCILRCRKVHHLHPFSAIAG